MSTWAPHDAAENGRNLYPYAALSPLTRVRNQCYQRLTVADGTITNEGQGNGSGKRSGTRNRCNISEVAFRILLITY